MQACEHVIDEATITVDKQAATLAMLTAQNKRLETSLDYELAQRAKEEVWYRDPKITGPVAFVLGVALGAYAVRQK